jgi:hypothetical protein
MPLLPFPSVIVLIRALGIAQIGYLDGKIVGPAGFITSKSGAKRIMMTTLSFTLYDTALEIREM